MVVPKLVNLNESANLLVISNQPSAESVCVSLFELNRLTNRLQTEYGNNQFTIDRSQARILSMPYVPSFHLHPRPSADIQIKGRLIDTLASVHVWNVSTEVYFSTFSFVHLNTSRSIYFAKSNIAIGVRVFSDEYQSVESLPVTIYLLDTRMQIMKRWHQVRSKKGLSPRFVWKNFFVRSLCHKFVSDFNLRI
jgi:hypothetical protein